MRAAWLAIVLAAGCGKPAEKQAPAARDAAAPAIDAAATIGAAAVTLPKAAPLPKVPVGLPPVNLDASVTPERVALGERLFFDKRISKGGAASCATCHDPDRGWGSTQARDQTVAGKPNLRHTPALVNLAWVTELGWDGRFPSAIEAVRAHWKGQLEVTPDDAIAALAADPVYASPW
jgi:cytochrome c peroxidase